MGNAKPPTMRDVARACGVSPNTVSLALHASDKVAPRTRERIQKVADEMGYVLDPRLSQLMSHLNSRRGREDIVQEVAWLNTIETEAKKPSHENIFAGAHPYLTSHGYRLSVYQLGPRLQQLSSTARVLKARGITGILLAPLAIGLSKIDLPLERLRGVAIGQRIEAPMMPKVDNDHGRSVYCCLEELSALGYQRIGAIFSSVFDAQVDHRMRAALLTFQSFCAESSRVPLLDVNAPPHTSALTVEMVLDWVREQEIDALLSFEEDIPILRSVQESVERRLGYASVSLSQWRGKAAGVVMNNAGVGETAARLLVSSLHNREFGDFRHPSMTLIPGVWEEGPEGKAALPM